MYICHSEGQTASAHVHSLKCFVQLQSTQSRCLEHNNALNLKSVSHSKMMHHICLSIIFNCLYAIKIHQVRGLMFLYSDTAYLRLRVHNHIHFFLIPFNVYICRQLQWLAFIYIMEIYIIRIIYHFWQTSLLLDIQLFCWSYLLVNY